MSATHALGLDIIRIDGGTQPRVSISDHAVSEYADHFQAGVLLPPIDVFFDGANYWLADGFHRYWAAKKVARLALTATVHLGTKRDAVLFSVAANIGHGLQRTNADKRKAVMTMLTDEEWTKWSNVEIGKRCGVSDHLVGNLRPSLRTVRSEAEVSLPESAGSEQSPTVKYTTKHGTDATMKVGKIGKQASGPVVEAKRAALAAKKAMAIEGAHPGVLKRRPSRSADKIITNVMHLLAEMVTVLETVDVAVLANDARAQQWHETTTAAMTALRAFLRKLERKTA